MAGIFHGEDGIFGDSDFESFAARTSDSGLSMRGQCSGCGTELTLGVDWAEAFEKLAQDGGGKLQIECCCPQCETVTVIKLKPSEILLIAVDELGFAETLRQINRSLSDAAQLTTTATNELKGKGDDAGK